MNFNEIKQSDDNYIMHTYGRFQTALHHGKGSTVYDVDGREYIDFTSGIGVNSLGFCNDELISAMIDQANKLQHISNLYYSEVQTQLAEKLCNLTGLSKVFFSNSGAEANECAIKLARKYSFDKYGKNRSDIVCLKNSFHGRTITTLSATGQDVFHNYFFPFTQGFKFGQANDFESIKQNIDEKTCAVMIELIQGEGGVKVLEKQFVQNVYDYCKQRDILLIIDEVQTGVGRTGKLYCYENYDITPDIMTSAKGLGGGVPIGACLCTKELENVMTPSTHGTTYGGNLVCVAQALKVIDIVSNENFLKEVNEKAKYIREKLLKMENVEELTGTGLMIGIILKEGNSLEIAKRCTENGLLILTAKTLLRMLPPLNITYEEIDKGLDILIRNA